jgi:hypothetical protein
MPRPFKLLNHDPLIDEILNGNVGELFGSYKSSAGLIESESSSNILFFVEKSMSEILVVIIRSKNMIDTPIFIFF